MKYFAFMSVSAICFSSVLFPTQSANALPTGETFSVQILLSENQLQPTSKKFKGVSDIHEEVFDGLFKYKYTTGHEAKTFAEAVAIRLKMIDAGFTDAFVVRYRDGKRLMTNNLAKAVKVKSDAVPLAVKPATDKPKITSESIELNKKVVIGSSVIQIKPEFPGGGDALELFIHNNLHYPVPPFDKDHPAQVFVSFTVDFRGRIKNLKVVGTLRDELDKEALRVINSMPAWHPGTIGGMPVNMDCFLPVDFHLPAEKQTAQSEGKK